MRIGREQESASVGAFVDREPRGAAALVLEGEPGIGKSVLWSEGVESARTRGFLVLSAQPAEPERGLAYVGLGDLFEHVLDEVLPTLPPPRRRALEVALLVEDARDDAVDPRALGTAVRSALELFSTEVPLLVAIDDLQWFDPSSARALAFALRRLQGSDVRLLAAERVGEGGARTAIDGALDPDRVQRLTVAPLSVGALHALLRDRVGQPFARQTLLRIHERSGGNPFFALELARVVDVGADPAQPPPIPETLEELVRARIAALPPSTKDALAFASALGAASTSVLRRAGVATDALRPAVAAQVIELDQSTVRFTHPLLASVLYDDLGEERRTVHGRLAAVVGDPLARARHLALSTGDPDAGIAAALDDAAVLAADRGATAVAAELAERALGLTPAGAVDDRRRRALAAARAHHLAGEWTRARTIVTELLAETGSGPLRAEALILLAELESIDRAAVLLDEALAEAESRPALQALIHCLLARATQFRLGVVRSIEHARAAFALAEQLDDDALRARSLAVHAMLAATAGEPTAAELASRAHELAIAAGAEALVQEATLAVAATLWRSGRHDEARAVLERACRALQDRDEPATARALWELAWVEFWAGRWPLAAEHAARAHEISIQYGIEVPQAHLPIALVAVHRGQLDVARRHSALALELAEEQLGLHPPHHLAVLGLVALGNGDSTGASERLVEADRQADTLEWGEPSLRWWRPDLAAVLVELGRVDEASRIVDRWEADATRLRRASVLAQVGRCRGLIAAARGDVDGALPLLERALLDHEAAGDSFGRARTLLALGIVRRRGRQKRPAREAIEEALQAFETLGAAGWAEQARAELGRIGGRRSGGGELTPTELRLAELVAEGRSNKEIAAVLFVTPKTVGTTLSRLYAKVGVRSRTELVRRLAERPPSKV